MKTQSLPLAACAFLAVLALQPDASTAAQQDPLPPRPPGGAPQEEGRRPMMPGMGPMMQGTMVTLEKHLFVLMGGTIYKVDPNTLEVLKKLELVKPEDLRPRDRRPEDPNRRDRD